MVLASNKLQAGCSVQVISFTPPTKDGGKGLLRVHCATRDEYEEIRRFIDEEHGSALKSMDGGVWYVHRIDDDSSEARGVPAERDHPTGVVVPGLSDAVSEERNGRPQSPWCADGLSLEGRSVRSSVRAAPVLIPHLGPAALTRSLPAPRRRRHGGPGGELKSRLSEGLEGREERGLGPDPVRKKSARRSITALAGKRTQAI